MTPDQKTLARHALGLPNPAKRSYRNRYYTGAADTLWDEMLAAGLAECELQHGGRRLFCLTEKGARLALEPGERLDPEDFPMEAA